MVTGLDNPQDYKVCVYEEGLAHTYFGPKPFENQDSSSPIDASGHVSLPRPMRLNVIALVLVGTPPLLTYS